MVFKYHTDKQNKGSAVVSVPNSVKSLVKRFQYVLSIFNVSSVCRAYTSHSRLSGLYPSVHTSVNFFLLMLDNFHSVMHRDHNTGNKKKLFSYWPPTLTGWFFIRLTNIHLCTLRHTLMVAISNKPQTVGLTKQLWTITCNPFPLFE